LAKLEAITPYGDMGSWNKGKTKNGETQELPLPTQLMPWLAAWKAIRPCERPSPYLFPGQAYGEAITSHLVRRRWHELRLILGITGLWNYDLRRTLVCEMGNTLHYSDSIRKAIINHTEHSAFGHYDVIPFDSLIEPIQRYADWLWGLLPESERQEPVLVAASQAVLMPAPPVPPRPVIAKPLPAEAEEWCRRLSERESEVLSWLGQGRTVKHIAEALSLSTQAVSTYRARLMGKLQLGSTGELMRFAILNDSVQEDPPTSSAKLRPKGPRVASSRRMIEREEWPG
jgi:DNA-binding CsgD family transcriptional regulator